MKNSCLSVLRLPTDLLEHSIEEIDSSLLKLISSERLVKISNFRFNADKWRTLAGELLLLKMLVDQNIVNCNNEILQFGYNRHSKPFLKVYPHVNFNISHAGSIVVCVMSSHNIGVDVEFMEKIDIKGITSFFSREEQEDISLLDTDESRLHYLYDLWTLKECYLKAVGKGISVALDSFTVKKMGGNIIVKENNSAASIFWDLQQYDTGDNDYKLAVCAVKGFLPDKIYYYNVTDIINL